MKMQGSKKILLFAIVIEVIMFVIGIILAIIKVDLITLAAVFCSVSGTAFFLH